MVRISECFECGAKENESKLVFTTRGPILCESCRKKNEK